jgi:AcrR family transcriptional regulator
MAPSRRSTPKRSALSRDAEATKQQIMKAAEEEFAAAGLSAARTDAIAASSGVTKAMIYYYFGSKEELYQAVLERAFTSRLQSLQQTNWLELPPEEALVGFLQTFLEHMASDRNLASLLFLEAVLNKGKYYPKETGASLYGTLRAILEQGIAQEVFRELDACHTAVNIVGTCVFYFSAYENVKFLWKGKRMLSKEMREQHARETIDLILAGVRTNSC